jgi:hypothetical protein
MDQMPSTLHWRLPASVLWVATRNSGLADAIADRAGAHAAYDQLAKVEMTREAFQLALGQLIEKCREGIVSAARPDGLAIPAAAWMLPVRWSHQGHVVAGNLERKPGDPPYRRRVVGGWLPIFLRADVMAAFPGEGAPMRECPPQAERQRGRPPADNEKYIARAELMLKEGEAEDEVRAFLKRKMMNELGIGVDATNKRLANQILPVARERAGK